MSIPAGVYAIQCVRTGTVADLDSGNPINGTKVQGWQQLSGDSPYSYNQLWYVQPLESGGYTFGNLASGTVLELAGGSSKNGTRIQGWERVLNHHNPNIRNQEWTLDLLSDGSYRITNKRGGTVLDLTDGDPANGTPLQGYEAANEGRGPPNLNQHWYFIRFVRPVGLDDDDDD